MSESSPIIPRNESGTGRRLGGLNADSQSVRLHVIQDAVAPRVLGRGASMESDASEEHAHDDGGDDSGSESGHESVRSERNRLTVRTGVPLPRFVMLVQTLLQLPPALAAAVVIPMAWPYETCDQPLFLWATVYAIAVCLELACVWSIEAEQSRRPREFSQRRRMAGRFRKPLENFVLGWLIIGQVWVQGASECESTAPKLFALCFWLVVLGFGYFLLPCAIIIMLLPFLCCCLPCVIRLLARFAPADGSGARRGASKQEIDALPVKRYHDGLFEGEEDPQCAICLSAYENDEELRVLPCDGRHHLHKACLDEWLQVNASCPICRAPIARDSGRENDGDDDDDAGLEEGLRGHHHGGDDGDERDALRPI